VCFPWTIETRRPDPYRSSTFDVYTTRTVARSRSEVYAREKLFLTRRQIGRVAFHRSSARSAVKSIFFPVANRTFTFVHVPRAEAPFRRKTSWTTFNAVTGSLQESTYNNTSTGRMTVGIICKCLLSLTLSFSLHRSLVLIVPSDGVWFNVNRKNLPHTTTVAV
jgi:hypothetical protein